MSGWAKRCAASLPCLILAVLTGCEQSDLPPRAPVSGTVTYDGSPLANAIITFVPDTSKGTQGTIAVGATDADGKYTLSTDRGEDAADGAVVGFHRVRITANRKSVGPADTLPPSRIPMHYNNPAKSGLVAEVKADVDNVLDFRLGVSKPTSATH